MSISRSTLTEPHLWEHSRYGVIQVATLEKLGIPQRTSYRRCQPGRQWTHLLPGIVLLSKTRANARQRVEAALMHADGLGVVTGFEAARRYGLKNVPAGQSVHLLLPEVHRINSVGFTVVERTLFMPEARHIDGVPLASPARAVLDGVRRIRELDPVRALLIETVESRLCTLDEFSAELEAGSRRGTALPRAVLREIDGDVRSVPEATSLSIWRRAKLPAAERNVKIYDAAGNYIAMPDAWGDEVAMAWEIDSYDHHFSKPDFATTLRRNNRYAAAGIIVVQTIPARLRSEPEAVIAELRAAYAAAAARPRPAVFMGRAAAA